MNRSIKGIMVFLALALSFHASAVKLKSQASLVGFNPDQAPDRVKKIGVVRVNFEAKRRPEKVKKAAAAAVADAFFERCKKLFRNTPVAKKTKKKSKKVVHKKKKKKQAKPRSSAPSAPRNLDDYGFTGSNQALGIKDYVFEDPSGHAVKVTLLLNAKLEAQKNVDAVVNPANSTLIGSAGVSDKLQNAAGPELVAYIEKHIQEDHKGHRCKVGQVKVTSAFNLRANGIKYILHTVGPKGLAKQRALLLQEAYTNVLKQAVTKSLRSIAIPAISIGIFGYPAGEAAQVAVATIVDFIHNNDCGALREIRLPIWDQPAVRPGAQHQVAGLNKDYFNYYRRLFEGKVRKPSNWERAKAFVKRKLRS